MEPLASNKLQRHPNGEPNRLRLMAKDSKLSGQATLERDALSIDKTAVSGLATGNDAARWKVSTVPGGSYAIFVWLRMNAVDDEDDRAFVHISIDGEDESDDRELVPSEYYQPVTMRRNIAEGKHVIEVSVDSPEGSVWLDRLELLAE